MRKIKSQDLTSYRVTIKEMSKMVNRFNRDILPYSNNYFTEWFDFVKNIPYEEDKFNEIIKRPKFIIEDFKGDCKKKSILIASWCRAYGWECRFIVSSTRQDKGPHHIYTEIKNGKVWINADATYKNGRIGKNLEKETYREVWEWLTE